MFPMNEKFKDWITNKTILGAAGAVFLLFAVLYSVYAFSDQEPVVLSQQFVVSRNNAADVGKEIVDLANETNRILRRVTLLNPQGEYRDILLLLDQAKTANDDAYRRAFTLSQYLRELTESLGSISSIDSQRLAYEAVATELSLVSEFITYTNYISSFLDLLSYSTPAEIETKAKQAENILGEINTSSKKINDLNSDFLMLMGKFDKSLQ